MPRSRGAPGSTRPCAPCWSASVEPVSATSGRVFWSRRPPSSAERECLADADARARARERAAEREALRDAEYVREFAERIGGLYPGCPEAERSAIAEHACRKYSGRVGRTAGAKRFEPEAIDLAVRAHVRHAHTRYDELLATGWARDEARAAVAAKVEKLLQRWRG